MGSLNCFPLSLSSAHLRGSTPSGSSPGLHNDHDDVAVESTAKCRFGHAAKRSFWISSPSRSVPTSPTLISDVMRRGCVVVGSRNVVREVIWGSVALRFFGWFWFLVVALRIFGGSVWGFGALRIDWERNFFGDKVFCLIFWQIT